jgi:hypothetical protein
MTPLYEVWVGTGSPTLSPGFNGCSSWTPALYNDYERVKLPLFWAKMYAEGLSKKFKRPVEVRNKNHKTKALFGMEAA